MAYRAASQKVHKVMIQPINVIFRHLQNRTRVSIWLYDRTNLKIEGVVIGFDEFMNIMLDDAEEVSGFNKTDGSKTKRRAIGRILLKGDNVCLMHPILNQNVGPAAESSIASALA